MRSFFIAFPHLLWEILFIAPICFLFIPAFNPIKAQIKFEKRDYLLHLFIYLPAKRNEKVYIF